MVISYKLHTVLSNRVTEVTISDLPLPSKSLTSLWGWPSSSKSILRCWDGFYKRGSRIWYGMIWRGNFICIKPQKVVSGEADSVKQMCRNPHLSYECSKVTCMMTFNERTRPAPMSPQAKPAWFYIFQLPVPTFWTMKAHSVLWTMVGLTSHSSLYWQECPHIFPPG